jgi:hypothetical protein
VGLGTEGREACGEVDYQLMTLRPMNEQQLRKEAERLIKAGKMPTLDELTQAILNTRREYATKIRRARREGK